jgi:ABC-type transport system involved in multi-copper enzyme maturation permease subunit
MQAVLAIAKATYRESIRQRVLLVVLLLGLLLIGVSVAFSYLSTGEEFRFVVDFGLTGFILVGLGLAVILGGFMIPTEIDRRIVFTVLTKPVSRAQYLWGKLLGAALTILVVDVLMGVAFVAAYYWKQPQHNVPLALYLALVAVFLQTLILLATAVFLSTISSSAFTVIATGFVYIVGSVNKYVTQLSQRGDSVLLKTVFGVLAKVIPNFQNFDLRQALLTSTPVDLGHLAGPVLGYTVVYVAMLMALAWLLFNEREF